jgi:hypothetical protein
MRLEDKLTQEFDHAVSRASTISNDLSVIGSEICKSLEEDRHGPNLSVLVLGARVRRAALVLTSLEEVVGQIDLLNRIGAL